MEMNEYRLKAEGITRKYAEFVEDFENATDDRRVAYNCIHQIIGACKDMEGQDNIVIRCAINDYIRKEMKTIDRIVTRFTGKVYKGVRWWTPEELAAIWEEREPETVSHRDFWIALCELRERFQPHNVSICDCTDENGIIELRVSWPSIGSTTPSEARDFAEWVQIASDAAEHFKYAGYRVSY